MNIVVGDSNYTLLLGAAFPEHKIYDGKSDSNAMSMAQNLLITGSPTVLLVNAFTSDSDRYQTEYNLSNNSLQHFGGDRGCLVMAKPRLEIMFFQVEAFHLHRIGMSLSDLELELAQYAPLLVVKKHFKKVTDLINKLDDEFIAALKKTPMFKEISTFAGIKR